MKNSDSLFLNWKSIKNKTHYKNNSYYMELTFNKDKTLFEINNYFDIKVIKLNNFENKNIYFRNIKKINLKKDKITKNYFYFLSFNNNNLIKILASEILKIYFIRINLQNCYKCKKEFNLYSVYNNNYLWNEYNNNHLFCKICILY